MATSNGAPRDVEMADHANGDAATPATAVKDATAAPAPGGREVDFKKLSQPEAFKLLKSTPEGLDDAQVADRLKEYGPNKLPEHSRSPILQFLGYLWNPLSWAMEAAAIIAIILLDYADFALILFLLLLNAVISFREEASADKAIKALTAALAPRAKAMRNGKLVSVDASDLVPGDVVLVRLGDVVPADIKLLGEGGEHDTPMQIDQAALTGESLPAKKFSGDVAFSGSAIKQGERHAVVYATGANTFFGRAAGLIGSTHNVANIQKIMTRIGAVCLVTIALWVIIELSVQFGEPSKGRLFGRHGHTCAIGVGNCPTLLNMLVIIVGGIPIAMPTVLSVTLALGAAKLAKEGAIVARQSAVEEMAGMDILCSDKTGTLTLNKLTVNQADVFPVSHIPHDEVLKYAALSANISTEEPIDMVMHDSYPGKDTLWENYTLKKFVPFNPVDKFTMAIVQEKSTGKIQRVMKGAPQVVLKKANVNREEVSTMVKDKINEFALRGFRALGVSVADGDQSGPDEFTMVAVVPMFDPPRHDTKDTIEKCIEKGIQVKMVTGDQLLIGKETAKQLGMGQNFYTTEELMEHMHNEGRDGVNKSAEQLVEEADGFAEVFPEHKYEIVAMLQRRHHMVAMTGDGVNDAPALKKADVGIAVAGATDAARGAADIVLTEEGLSVIVSAIIGARKIFQRMTTYSKYTVAMTFRIAFTFGLLTVLYDWYFPTLLIVLLAVFNDGAMIALSKDRVVASRMPNSWHLGAIFGQGIVYGLYLTLSTWILYYVATKMDFFETDCHLPSLNLKTPLLQDFCRTKLGATSASVCAVPGYRESFAGAGDCRGVSQVDQCATEQYYVRASMLRALIYNQVSISGQALVFVVRDQRWSLMTRAGAWTYGAFFAAQIASTIISAVGFNGYPWPPTGVENCQFCQLSTGAHHPIFSRQAPLYGTESVYTDSTIGCLGYVIVAWIWSILFYLGLDPIKWAMAWAMNEDGFRTRTLARRRHAPPPEITLEQAQAQGPSHMLPATYANPLGRASISRPTPAQFERASVVLVDESGRVTAGKSAQPAGPPNFLQRVSASMMPGDGTRR
ncbi:hypothetical protein WJX81_003766 [Elliptochloris bilobata]|uniref:Plasma membrane ATPase n=1 Tax=Elliptochloris bilobata TaxID=381761 RepID=A0AAW1RWP4_9CHLO